jgi:excisionase family DNA binding protein
MTEAETLELILLTVEQTAKMLNVSVKTLEKWRAEGIGPRFIKVGRRVMYTLTDGI